MDKNDAIEQRNYRGLKLLKHMKVFERVITQKIWEVADIDAMQFGFMPSKGTMDAIL